MINHTVNSYDKDLDSLGNAIIDMGKLVIEMLSIAKLALTDTMHEYVDQAKFTDKKINNYDIEIERKAIALIALRQPMAIDLRLVISAIKLAVIMERMGDLAKNTVKRSAKIGMSLPKDIEEQTVKMIDIIVDMLENVLTAFKDKDDEAALDICKYDEEVDDIYHALTLEIEKQMSVHSNKIDAYMQMIMSIKNIERIGDYVTKFAKILHYIVCGEMAIKNAKQKLSGTIE